MIYKFEYESDVLAEERGLDSCVLIEIEMEVTFDLDAAMSYTVTNFYDLGDGHAELHAQSPDFIMEVTRHAKLHTDVNHGDIYQEWCEWLVDADTDLSHLEDRDE